LARNVMPSDKSTGTSHSTVTSDGAAVISTKGLRNRPMRQNTRRN
jgi:hypothetical protein